jgi:hypothetical protein
VARTYLNRIYAIGERLLGGADGNQDGGAKLPPNDEAMAIASILDEISPILKT